MLGYFLKMLEVKGAENEVPISDVFQQMCVSRKSKTIGFGSWNSKYLGF